MTYKSLKIFIQKKHLQFIRTALLLIGTFNLYTANAQWDGEEALSDTSNFKIELLPINSVDNDYHAIPYKNGLVFTSSRSSNWGIVYTNNTGSKFTDLFFTEIDNKGIWTRPKKFPKPINSKLNEGPFCFNDSGNVIYFTTNKDYTKKDFIVKNSVNLLKIYKATFINEEWTNIESFIFNDDHYNVGHPALSNNGKRLYFASDMPGGFGGSDIYESILYEGQWSKPINLGSKINTQGNESFPFLSKDGRLYFSSNGHVGLGKLDIYSSEFENLEWKNVKNLEAPINSSSDDFSYYTEVNNSSGYFSSNRLNEKDDNIYKFKSLKTPCDSLHEINKCFTFFEQGTSLENEKGSLVYEWDLGDGSKHRGLEVNHCYAHGGDFKIMLNVIDTITNHIFFNEASYSIDIPEITSPYFELKDKLHTNTLIDFDGRKSKLKSIKIKELIWDFGDGVKAVGPRYSHTYMHKGNYQVSLLAIGIDSLNNEIQECIFKIIHILNPEDSIPAKKDSVSKITDIATKVFGIDKSDDITYSVQVTSSESPLDLHSEKFKGLLEVSEYEDNGVYGYTVGKGNTLEEMYPLYNDVKVKGFDEAQVIAFKNNKNFTHKVGGKKPLLNGKSYTHISGRVMTRFGDPIKAQVVLENLTTGKLISIQNNELDLGKYSLELPNGEIYGYYAKKDSFYSVSNFIDLRLEKRNLEVKKNIEMIYFNDLDEENLALRINNLFFDSNKFNISAESYPELRRLIEVVKKSTNLNVEVSGHTDNVGAEEVNLILSQKRADAVRDYLIAAGCPVERLKAIGYGYSKPLVSNNTEKGKYLNRRVEIKFIKR